jgi:hypothetical protein
VTSQAPGAHAGDVDQQLVAAQPERADDAARERVFGQVAGPKPATRRRNLAAHV